MRVVICGAGVIGACAAYFLSLRQVEVVVVERTGVACAASGKSGGFLALDWCARARHWTDWPAAASLSMASWQRRSTAADGATAG